MTLTCAYSVSEQLRPIMEEYQRKANLVEEDSDEAEYVTSFATQVRAQPKFVQAQKTRQISVQGVLYVRLVVFQH